MCFNDKLELAGISESELKSLKNGKIRVGKYHSEYYQTSIVVQAFGKKSD